MLRRIHSSRGREPWADPAVLFAALGDETRLRLVSRLCREGPLSITRLSDGIPMTRQAVTKHLRLMEHAGVVSHAPHGREQLWQVEPGRLADAQRHLEKISAQWDETLGRLKRFVERPGGRPHDRS
jgi:DNA-binding transcriptional ArsR family regulator